MKELRYFFTTTFLFILFYSCTPELDAPKPDAGNADFSKTIAVGGNFLAGYQNGALFEKGQKLSIPALLAQQFQLVGGIRFNQVLMPDNNGLGLNIKPWESNFVTPSLLGYKTDCKGVTALSPLKNTISQNDATPYLVGVAGNSNQSITVPYAGIADYFSPSLGNSFSSGNKNPYYHRIASYPGISTMFEDAKNQKASFAIVWVGMEDIYNYASTGGAQGSIPSVSVFSMYLDSLLKGITANGAKGIIANIPDFRVFPYYTLVKWDNAVLTKVQADSLNDVYVPAGLSHINFVEGRNGFIIEDINEATGYRQLHAGEYLTLSVPLDSMKCNKYGLLVNIINDRYALDSVEVSEIDLAIASYNAVIQQKAAQYNFAFADMNTYFKNVESGIKWDGADFNSVFVSGGFFSLDGYHPNQKGYALITNEFIKAINEKYQSVIPTVNCVECDGIIFP